ncbi:MAG: hypothetical protein ACOYKZ_00300 [Chlamydiia bacterium]
MSVVNELEELSALVDRWAPGASIQEETQQVVSVLHLPQGDVPVFLRYLRDAQLLQLVAFLPCDLVDRAVSDLGRFLHLINKGLDRPGLGIDEVFRVVFYRLVLPCAQNGVDEQHLQEAWEAMEGVVETFCTYIRPVASGQLDFTEVVTMLANQDEEALTT